MRRLARADLAVALAAVAAVAALGFALRPQHTAITAVAPADAAVARPATAMWTRPTLLVVGDAYTAGTGLTETSYACKAAANLGWLCKLAAEPGTGYISGGTANRFPLNQGSGKSTSFGERIPMLGALYQPDVVILDGGRNDTFAPPLARFQVTASTIWQAHQTWPNAKIVFVKPRFLTKPDDDLGIDDAIIKELKNASGVQDLIVVDPVAGIKDAEKNGLISPDGTNPSTAGERELAGALSRELARNGIRPVT